jgi:hypothetical protein
MKHRLHTALFVLMLALDAPRALLADPPREATAAFDAYCRGLDQRLIAQHATGASFLASPDSIPHPGELHIERVTASPNIATGARLDHWRGTTFVPGATAAAFEDLLRNFSAYPTTFSPEVLSARATPLSRDHLLATMRVRQHHVITVVMDATYDVTFAESTPQRGYSRSRSTSITEIDSAGTPREHPLSPAQEHGFLWRLNTWWSWEERDGGLAIQIETVSLSRSVPRGLGWIVGPYVDSIPRESLEFTLTHARDALQHQHERLPSTPTTQSLLSKESH